MVPNTTCTLCLAAASTMAAVGSKVAGMRHGSGIGLREADEMRAFLGGARDGAHGLGDVLLVLSGPVADGLDHCDAEGHGSAPFDGAISGNVKRGGGKVKEPREPCVGGESA